jgi:hypothetical protein
VARIPSPELDLFDDLGPDDEAWSAAPGGLLEDEFLGFAAPFEPPTWRNQSHGNSATDATSYTFTAVPIGTAASDRSVVVGIYGRRSGAISCTGVTIGGVNAALLAQVNANSDANASVSDVSLWVANVPSGITADVVATFDNTSIRCGYALATINGVDPAPFDTAAAQNSDTLADTINVPADGAVFAFAGGSFGASYTGAAWTGATEFADAQIGAEQSAYAAASIFGLPAQTARSLQCAFTMATGVDQGLVAASFGPPAGAAIPRFFSFFLG